MAQTKTQLVDYGTAVASSVPTNGPYLAAANTVAISTNGSQRVTVDSSGRVGVGTTTPGALLDLGSATVTQGYIKLRSTGAGAREANIYSPATGGLTIDTNSYTYPVVIQADSVQFGTGSSGTERARIDSSGRLLVGTSSTSQTGLLQVQGNQSNPGGSADVYLRRGEAATSITSGEAIGYLIFTDNAGGTFGWIGCDADATAGNNDYPGRLVFSTTADGASSPTERMRISNAGIVHINATSISGPTGQLYIEQDAGSIRNLASFNNTASGTGSTGFINFSRNGTATGNISNTGSATAYNTSSDYRLKENVKPVTDGITRLQQLKPSRFNFIADPEKTVDGFIAHEVQEVIPEAITGDKDAVGDDGNPVYQGIDQSKLVPLLTAALQEAIAKIETLEARLTAAGIA